MFYLMIQSLRRRPKVHRTMLFLLICALLLPLLLGILGDSIAYGRWQQAYQTHRFSHYIIHGANKSQLPAFSKLSPFRAEYADGKIYLFYTKDADLKKAKEDYAALLSDEKSIQGLLSQLDAPGLSFSSFVLYEHEDEVGSDFLNQITFIKLFAHVLAMALVCISYHVHMDSFSREIKILRAQGAARKHIAALFSAEAFALYLFSSAIATPVAYFGMKIIISNLLHISEGDMGWILFHFSWGSYVFLLLFFALTMLAVLFLALRRLFRKESADAAPISKKKRRIKKQPESKASFAVPRMMLKRDGKGFLLPSVIAFPAIALIVFLLQYVNTNAMVLTLAPRADYSITKLPAADDPQGYFSEQEMGYIKSLPGVSKLHFLKRTDNGEYLLALPDDIASSLHERDYVEIFAKRYMPCELISAETLDDEGKKIQPGQLFISKNQPQSKWKEGESLLIFKKRDLLGFYLDESGNMVPVSRPAPPKSFTVSALIDNHYVDGPLRLYLHPSDYAELISDIKGFRSAELVFDTQKDPAETLRAIRSAFSNDQKFMLKNIAQEARTSARVSRGLYLYVTWVLLILFVVVFLTSLTLVFDHMRKQAPAIRILRQLGAEKTSIYYFYRWQSLFVSGLCLLLSFLLGTVLSRIYFADTGYYAKANLFMAAIYACIVLAHLFSYLFPVQKTLHQFFRQAQ